MTKEDREEIRLAEAEIAFENYKIQKRDIIDQGLKLPGINKAKVYYPLTQTLLGVLTLADGEHLHYLNQKKVKTPKRRPIIFANTHKFKPDIEKITLSLNKSSVMVASDFKNAYKTKNGWYLNTRPTVYVDPYSKTDKAYTYKMIVRTLKERNNCMIFPEAVWNFSENKIILDIYTGTVRAALESNGVIVGTAIERYGKDYVINRKGYYDPQITLRKYTNKSFEEINSNPKYKDLRKQIIKECNTILRDDLATLTYEIWEAHAQEFGYTARESIPEDYWEQFINGLMEEWPGYKLSDNVEQRVQNKEDLKQQQVQNEMKHIRENLNMKNLFLFTEQNRYERAKQLFQNYENEEVSRIKSQGYEEVSKTGSQEYEEVSKIKVLK